MRPLDAARTPRIGSSPRRSEPILRDVPGGARARVSKPIPGLSFDHATAERADLEVPANAPSAPGAREKGWGPTERLRSARAPHLDRGGILGTRFVLLLTAPEWHVEGEVEIGDSALGSERVKDHLHQSRLVHPNAQGGRQREDGAVASRKGERSSRKVLDLNGPRSAWRKRGQLQHRHDVPEEMLHLSQRPIGRSTGGDVGEGQALPHYLGPICPKCRGDDGGGVRF